MCSTRALKHFNKTSRAKRGLQYELVEALGSKPFITRSLNYDCNFRAKPKGTPDNETKLFFAEFVGRKVIQVHLDVVVLFFVNQSYFILLMDFIMSVDLSMRIECFKVVFLSLDTLMSYLDA
ncbi:hypothetical protein Ancab_033128 [Ancistrocladus abbreviatus]